MISPEFACQWLLKNKLLLLFSYQYFGKTPPYRFVHYSSVSIQCQTFNSWEKWLCIHCLNGTVLNAQVSTINNLKCSQSRKYLHILYIPSRLRQLLIKKRKEVGLKTTCSSNNNKVQLEEFTRCNKFMTLLLLTSY